MKEVQNKWMNCGTEHNLMASKKSALNWLSGITLTPAEADAGGSLWDPGKQGLHSEVQTQPGLHCVTIDS